MVRAVIQSVRERRDLIPEVVPTEAATVRLLDLCSGQPSIQLVAQRIQLVVQRVRRLPVVLQLHLQQHVRVPLRSATLDALVDC